MRGGARLGAGRKPNSELIAIRKLLDARFGGEQWEDLFYDLYEAARRGDCRAAQLLMRYRFGNPRERDDVSPLFAVASSPE